MATKKAQKVQAVNVEKKAVKKTVKKPSPKAEVVEVVLPKRKSEIIWEMIKDLPMDIFALPNQSVHNHVTREAKLEAAVPDAVHVTLKSTAVYPALEETLARARVPKDANNKPQFFELSQSANYTVIRLLPKN